MTGSAQSRLVATFAAAWLASMAFTAPAADNSGIVILDQQQRSTPFGRYDSRRRTQVYGPSSGFRYEEYRTPVAPVYPRYRDGYDRRGGYAYGPGYRGHREGRVIEHYGRGAYGRFGAPAAPHVNDRFGRPDDRDRSHNASRRGDTSRFGADTGRQIEPAERAIQSPQRAIR